MAGWYDDKAMTVAVMSMMTMIMMMHLSIDDYAINNARYWLFSASQAGLLHQKTRKQNDRGDVGGAWDCLCVCTVSKWRAHLNIFSRRKVRPRASNNTNNKKWQKRKITTDVNVIFGVCACFYVRFTCLCFCSIAKLNLLSFFSQLTRNNTTMAWCVRVRACVHTYSHWSHRSRSEQINICLQAHSTPK